jgi:MATE family multidrug resistance protein
MHYSDNILILVGQDAEISVMARNYIVWILPGCFMSIQFEARKRFLQSIQQSYIVTLTLVVTTIFHLFWCYLFIFGFEMGMLGLALAINLTYSSNLVIAELLCHYLSRFKAFKAPLLNRQSFQGWL